MLITLIFKDVINHLVLPVVRQGAAVLQLGFVLISVDQLTQITEVSNHRTDKLCSCKNDKEQDSERTAVSDLVTTQ